MSEAVAFPFNRADRSIGFLPAKAGKFRVGPRKDLENFVAGVLRDMGLTETRGMDWELYIGLQFKTEYEKNYLLAPNGSVATSIPGLKETFGDKEAFSRLWHSCIQGGDPELRCFWTTPSYNLIHKPLPDEPDKFGLGVEGGAANVVRELREGPLPSTWIVKPQRRYLSLGMHLATLTEEDVADVDAFAAWAAREVPAAEKKKKHHTKQPGEFTIQRYVDHPGLVGPRKFDLRLWLLVASLEPLELYLLDVGFPKVSVVDYDFGLPVNTTYLADKCMHILMMASEFCTKRMSFPVFPFPYPGTSLARSFLEHFNEGTWREWQLELWPLLEKTLLYPLLLAKPLLESHDARIFGAFDNNRSRAYTRVALLSPDAIWDADARSWRLEEINTNGLFQLGADDPNVKTFHVDQGYTKAWLRMAGADAFPNRPMYADALERRLEAFCDARGCDDHDRDVLRRAAHRNTHLDAGWYRLFPPVDCRPNCGPRSPALDEDPVFQREFKPGFSTLANKHWDFLRGLDTSLFPAARADAAALGGR